MIVGLILIVIAFVIVPGLLMANISAPLHWSIFGAVVLVTGPHSSVVRLVKNRHGVDTHCQGFKPPRVLSWVH